MRQLFSEFVNQVASASIEVYNEFSLQHELGIFLRTKLSDYKIQFERNVEYFGLDKKQFPKKEIDISIFLNPQKPLCAIEVKFPRNGRHPESMFDFCGDISFCEKLKEKGFEKSYALSFADDPLFYDRGSTEGIYGFFRDGKPIHGIINKPTGKDKNIKTHDIKGTYIINWGQVNDNTRWYVVETT